VLTTSTERGQGPLTKSKRKYRRHPKPDDNAPERPPSAYVIFSSKVREEVKDKSLSFTQIAKLVGDRWQKLNPTSKEPFEAQANAAKERYNIQLSAYRKTDMYEEYMQYLSEFKAKHGQPSEHKRPRVNPESSGSIVSVSSFEINSEAVSGHVRGDFTESLPSSPYIGASTQSSTSLRWAAALPRPPPASPGSGSPLSQQQNRRPFRPGLISRNSSQSDESSIIRNDLHEPLMRTAVLNLRAVSGTPPLQTPTSSTPTIDAFGSPVLFGSSKLPYYPQQQRPLPSTPPMIATVPPQVSSPSFSLPLPSPTIREASWRSHSPYPQGSQEAPKMVQSSVPFNTVQQQQQLSLSRMAPLMPSDTFPEPTSSSHLRTLSPLMSPPLGVSILPYLGRGVGQPRPYPTDALHRPSEEPEDPHYTLEASESNAAHTLAGLAAAASRSRTAKPPPISLPSEHLDGAQIYTYDLLYDATSFIYRSTP
jgi:hypothetical protein